MCETSSEKYYMGMKYTPGNDILNQNNIASNGFIHHLSAFAAFRQV